MRPRLNNTIFKTNLSVGFALIKLRARPSTAIMTTKAPCPYLYPIFVNLRTAHQVHAGLTYTMNPGGFITDILNAALTLTRALIPSPMTCFS